MPTIAKDAERVNVIKQIKFNKKWRMAAVVQKQGKITRDLVRVAGREERHPEGGYFLIPSAIAIAKMT